MAVKDEHVRAMRWLYDDEKSYQKAVTKLRLEELKARKEKELIRRYRKRQLRILLHKFDSVITPIFVRTKQQVSKKRLIFSGVIIGIVIFSLVIWGIHGQKVNFGLGKTLSTAADIGQGQSIVKPNFTPALPSDNPKVVTTQNNQHAIIVYTDTYNKVQLTVSQQALPDNFKTDPTAIVRVAKEQLKATNSVTTDKGELYYLTNNTGQQWAVVQYQDLLIFLQTNSKLDDSGWAGYMQQLQVK